jgi:hypothetical protein
MILIDSNQIFIACAMVYQKNNGKLDEHHIKSMIFSSICNYIKGNRAEYGEVIVCIDSIHSWRRAKFEHYKSNRRKSKKTDSTDWFGIYNIIDSSKRDMMNNFPFRVVETDGAEADDVIAVLVKNNTNEKHLIVSSDKDYFQLHKYPNVRQFSPMAKRMVKPDNSASNYLREHIIRGDKGDGVPNILSDDASFVDGIRQTPITKRKLDQWFGKTPREFCNDLMLRNYHRNELLIDFDSIPKDIEDSVIEVWTNYKVNTKTKLLNYFIKNKYRDLISEVDNF